MAILSKSDLIGALTRLGEMANSEGKTVELLLLGGSLMVLVFETRQSTQDLDVVILSPPENQYSPRNGKINRRRARMAG
jgi:hypothetical protein